MSKIMPVFAGYRNLSCKLQGEVLVGDHGQNFVHVLLIEPHLGFIRIIMLVVLLTVRCVMRTLSAIESRSARSMSAIEAVEAENRLLRKSVAKHSELLLSNRKHVMRNRELLMSAYEHRAQLSDRLSQLNNNVAQNDNILKEHTRKLNELEVKQQAQDDALVAQKAIIDKLDASVTADKRTTDIWPAVHAAAAQSGARREGGSRPGPPQRPNNLLPVAVQEAQVGTGPLHPAPGSAFRPPARPFRRVRARRHLDDGARDGDGYAVAAAVSGV